MSETLSILIYTTGLCPYCIKSKTLLKHKGVEFTEINIKNEEEKQEMIKKAGGKKSFPQIFINEKHIGGCDDLFELNASGQLNKLLGL